MEQLIVQHCAPTLAGLKTANLMNCRKDAVLPHLETLCKKGIETAVLGERGENALVYVFRRSKLRDDLAREDVKELLKGFGYTSSDVDECISHLRERISASACFPHEIGLFLGYPVEDVRGFIEHEGKDFKCMGYWKVYCNECEARKTFARYKKCIDVYTRVYLCGSTIEKLTVAV